MSRVLLIADQSVARDELAIEIAHGPHTVKAVSAGDLRMSAARDWSPDIILMDLSSDGAALPMRIRMMRDPELASVPFVAMGDSEEEARALGAHAFVRIPAPLEPLMQLLARFGAMRMPLPA
jgi:CheY-like chemotaxis protein